ncbi:nucleotidyltransferase family protein [Yoonia sp. 208BN28-4]|uniref:nucleotidyltransferase family protein n=1 Tax=Yoonia sp. 208BN28-4 TaxID=3126505 RepID=UPI0030B2F62B
MIPTLILAAGTSSRMRGADKLLENVGGEPLLARQIKLAATTGGLVFVALPPKAGARHEVVAQSDAVPLIAPDAADGMGATLRNAVELLPPCAAFMVMLADLPDLDAEDMQAMIAAFETQPDKRIWRGATDDGKAGHPIIFSAALRPAFAKLQGDDGAAAIVQANEAQMALVPLSGNHARLDLDTPEDWAAWRAANG